MVGITNNGYNTANISNENSQKNKLNYLCILELYN